MIDGYRIFGDAIATWLNGLTLSLVPNAVRRNNYVWQGEKRGDLETLVRPAAKSYLPGTRKRPQRNYQYVIAVKQQIGGKAYPDVASQEARIDSLHLLMDEIEEAVIGKESFKVSNRDYTFRLILDTPQIPHDPDAIRENQVFLQAINVEVIEA